jgi:hypothetical protein
MWTTCIFLSVGCLVAAVLLALTLGGTGLNKKWGWKLFHVLVAGVFCATLVMFLPVHSGGRADGLLALWRTVLLSVFTSIQVFAAGCEFGVMVEGMETCPPALVGAYQAWSATLFVLAPVFTFGFILSLFQNLTAYLRYLSVCFRDVYIFSELNEGSMALAEDTDAYEGLSFDALADAYEYAYWLGYIYRFECLLHEESSRMVYGAFSEAFMRETWNAMAALLRDVALRDTADRICRKLDELLVGKLWPTLRLPQAASLAMGTTA